MSTSLEQVHELEPHVRIGRARAAVIMFILSDVLSVLAVVAAGGYLNTLNTENQYKVAGDFAPPFVPGLLIAIGLVLSGLCYFWWERRARQSGETGQTVFFLVAWVLMLAAGVADTWIGAALRCNRTCRARVAAVSSHRRFA